jgi:hypothetical protein
LPGAMAVVGIRSGNCLVERPTKCAAADIGMTTTEARSPPACALISSTIISAAIRSMRAFASGENSMAEWVQASPPGRAAQKAFKSESRTLVVRALMRFVGRIVTALFLDTPIHWAAVPTSIQIRESMPPISLMASAARSLAVAWITSVRIVGSMVSGRYRFGVADMDGERLTVEVLHLHFTAAG